MVKESDRTIIFEGSISDIEMTAIATRHAAVYVEIQRMK